jgi:hypothetical protein
VWGADLRATWTYHPSRRAAAALAPADAPCTIVDIARKPWIHYHSIGKGVPMTPQQLRAAQDTALKTNGRQLKPHPRGLEGRVRDALDDAELIAADPLASPRAKEAARRYAAAMVAALAAED